VGAESAQIAECGLCGALVGDDAAITDLLVAREARERGFDPQVYPLVRTLARLPRVRIVRASAGDPDRGSWPVLFLAVEEKGLRSIEKIAKSLALHARQLRLHWTLEVEFQERLLFLLQPRFGSPAAVGSREVEAARHDLATLSRLIERDTGLAWWHE
jgi:hypothetical protein